MIAEIRKFVGKFVKSPVKTAVVVYLIYKIQSNIIYLFDDQKVLFKIDLFVGVITTVIAILFFMFASEEYIYLNRVIVGLVLIVFFTYFYKYQFYKKMWDC